MNDHDDRPDRAGRQLADLLELAGAGMTYVDTTELSEAGRVVRAAGRLVDALGLDRLVTERGLEAVLRELVGDVTQAAASTLEPADELIEATLPAGLLVEHDAGLLEPDELEVIVDGLGRPALYAVPDLEPDPTWGIADRPEGD
jgi:hypothetical protein